MNEHEKSSKEEVIEIPVGRYLGKVRNNPWIIATFVLGIAFVLSLIFGGGNNGVGADVAAGKTLEFLNTNPELQGQINLVSVGESGSFYEVLVGFQGDQVPVY